MSSNYLKDNRCIVDLRGLRVVSIGSLAKTSCIYLSYDSGYTSCVEYHSTVDRDRMFNRLSLELQAT